MRDVQTCAVTNKNLHVALILGTEVKIAQIICNMIGSAIVRIPISVKRWLDGGQSSGQSIQVVAGAWVR